MDIAEAVEMLAGPVAEAVPVIAALLTVDAEVTGEEATTASTLLLPAGA